MSDNKSILGDFAKDLIKASDPEVERAKQSFPDFVKYVMRDPQGRPFEPQPFHLKMMDAIANNRLVHISAFRGSGKSSITSIAYPLYTLMRNRDARIILVSESERLVKDWMRDIETYMHSSPYKKLAGELVPEGQGEKLTWTSVEKIVRGRSESARGVSLLAIGAHGQIRGRRADVVVVDDVVSENLANTQYLRDQLSNWFWNALIPVLDHNPAEPLSGQCIVIGTPLYDNDLYAELVAKWSDEETQANANAEIASIGLKGLVN